MPKLRSLALIAAAVAVPGALTAPAAAAEEAGSMAVWRIVCVETEDSTGPDEVYLTYSQGGAHLWGPSSMNNGDQHDISGVSVNPGDNLTIWDQDNPGIGDPDDNLGERVVPSGPGPHMITFEGQGGTYQLYVG